MRIGGVRPTMGRDGENVVGVETAARFGTLQGMICGEGAVLRGVDKQDGFDGEKGSLRERETKKEAPGLERYKKGLVNVARASPSAPSDSEASRSLHQTLEKCSGGIAR